jgi:sensory rhodopsin
MIPNLTPLQLLVQLTFTITFFGMVAASVFMALQKNAVAREYRSSMAISCVILLIAAMNYYFMRDIYIVGIASGVARFPTEFRYIDWVLTVPLMLVKFPSILGMGPKGVRFLMILVLLALIMIVTGFIGEINITNALVHFSLFGVGGVAWVLIVLLLFFSLKELPPDADPFKRDVIRRMAFFVLVGWMVYPIGYLAPSYGLPADVREFVYNIADLVNKVGLALVVYSVGMRRQAYDEEVAAQYAAGYEVEQGA